MVTEPVDSWGILWDEKYANNVFMLDSIRDSMGITLKYLGYSMNTREITALEAAKNKLIEQKALGIADDITEAANEVLSLSTSGMKVALQVGMAVMPFLAILIAFIAIRRKYRLTEKTHEAMLQEIASRDH